MKNLKGTVKRLEEDNKCYKLYYSSLLLRKIANFLIIEIFKKHYNSIKVYYKQNSDIEVFKFINNLENITEAECNKIIDYLFMIRDDLNEVAHLENYYSNGLVLTLKQLIELIELKHILIEKKDSNGNNIFSIVTLSNISKLFNDMELSKEVDLSYHNDYLQIQYKRIINKNKSK